MKKIIAVIMLLICIISLVGCGGGNEREFDGRKALNIIDLKVKS